MNSRGNSYFAFVPMEWMALLTIFGLTLFESVSSLDNAVINAEVLATTSERARKWFLRWGILIAVFLVRGLLPWIIVWVSLPGIGFIDSFFAMFSEDPAIAAAIVSAAPNLLMAGGIFLVFLFLHWLFLEKKNFGLKIEPFFERQGIWFYTVVSVLLCVIVWEALKISNHLGLAAVIGSTAFFITHGFKQQAEMAEENLLKARMSDVSKILYLEVIDMSFSIDGVLGAFAFTLSVPLILAGNGLGAIVVRYLTVKNIDNIKKYVFLKNGAMYSILFLGVLMVMEGFGHHFPAYASPLVTIFCISWFFLKSRWHIKS